MNLHRTSSFLAWPCALATLTAVALAQPSLSLGDSHTPRSKAPWAATFGGSSADRVENVARAPGGGFFLAGHTFSFNEGAEQVWVARIDEDGRARWEVAIGGATGTSFSAMHPTAEGGCILVGRVSFPGNAQGWIGKLTGNGALEWQRTYNGTGDDMFTAVARSPRGFYVGGTVQQTASFHDACVLEIDPAGNILWQKRFAGDAEDRVTSLATTADGVAVVIASQSSFPGRPSVPGVPFTRPWLLRLDGNGGVLWQKTYNLSGGDVWTHIIAVEGGGFVATGEILAAAFFRGDVWVVRLDDAGVVQWDHRFGDVAVNWVDSASQVIATGDGGFAMAGSTATAGAGSEDLWLLKVDAQGSLLWSRTYGGTGFDNGRALAQFDNGDLLLAGMVQFVTPNPSDGLLLRLASDGQPAPHCIASTLTTPNQWTSALQIDAPMVVPTDLQFAISSPDTEVLALRTLRFLCPPR